MPKIAFTGHWRCYHLRTSKNKRIRVINKYCHRCNKKRIPIAHMFFVGHEMYILSTIRRQQYQIEKPYISRCHQNFLYQSLQVLYVTWLEDMKGYIRFQ